jgi:hypothetical protein
MAKATEFEPIIRDAAVKVLDSVHRKLENTRVNGRGPLGKLLRKWGSLEPDEKEEFIAIAITVGTAAAAAFAAMSPKRAGKNVVKRVVRKMT